VNKKGDNMYILIIVLYGSLNITSTNIPGFVTKTDCEFAAVQLKKDLGNIPIDTACVYQYKDGEK